MRGLVCGARRGIVSMYVHVRMRVSILSMYAGLYLVRVSVQICACASFHSGARSGTIVTNKTSCCPQEARLFLQSIIFCLHMFFVLARGFPPCLVREVGKAVLQSLVQGG